MKISFVIGTMSSGGAERVISEMSNYWAKKGWDISIVTIGAMEGKKDFYPLDSSIKRVDLSVKPYKFKINIPILLWKIRTFIKKDKPDVVISFITQSNIIVLLALMGIKVKKIISDRADPYKERVGFFPKKVTYPLCDTLVIQTDGVKKFYEKIPSLKVVTIPNPISKATIEKNKSFKFNSPTIVAMGTLKKIKGFDILISAFANIHKKYPDWNLVIFGEGKDRIVLEELIKEHHLQNKVFLPSLIDNPRNTIADADIFVLSSLKEGFPNVLIEAMSVGLPCISFDCNFGPSEIIDNNKNGILIETGHLQALQDAIEKLISSKSLRDELGKRAKEDSMNKYYIDNIMKEWEKEL